MLLVRYHSDAGVGGDGYLDTEVGVIAVIARPARLQMITVEKLCSSSGATVMPASAVMAASTHSMVR